MKHAFTIACCTLCMAILSQPVMAKGEDNAEAHIAYVLKNLSLKKETSARLRPLLTQYYQEVSRVKTSRKALKKKYQKAEDAGKLTSQQCDELFESKQKQEAGELDIRRRYYTKFKTVLTTPQAYEAIKLCNDKVK